MSHKEKALMDCFLLWFCKMPPPPNHHLCLCSALQRIATILVFKEKSAGSNLCNTNFYFTSLSLQVFWHSSFLQFSSSVARSTLQFDKSAPKSPITLNIQLAFSFGLILKKVCCCWKLNSVWAPRFACFSKLDFRLLFACLPWFSKSTPSSTGCSSVSYRAFFDENFL